MQMHCQDCGWVGCCTELLSGEDDGHGSRGVCPNCGADEEEFATALTLPYQSSTSPKGLPSMP